MKRPLSREPVGLGWLPDARTILHLAKPETKRVSHLLIVAAAAIHCLYDRTGWICSNPIVPMPGLIVLSGADGARRQ